MKHIELMSQYLCKCTLKKALTHAHFTRSPLIICFLIDDITSSDLIA